MISQKKKIGKKCNTTENEKTIRFPVTYPIPEEKIYTGTTSIDPEAWMGTYEDPNPYSAE